MEGGSCTFNTENLSLADTGYFSKLILDYISGEAFLKPFYQYEPNLQGIKQAIEARKQFAVDRQALVTALQAQYGNEAEQPSVTANIQLLVQDNTFTICTAHQPNLATGYAYFIYKIMHAVVLSRQLKTEFPEYNFVPVYYMGSEDDDIDELGFFRFNEYNFRWQTQQTGAVGSMQTTELKSLLDDFFNILGPTNANTTHLKQLFIAAYLEHNTIAEATRYLVHQLMGQYGVVVVDPQDDTLKEKFKAIVKEELFRPQAHQLVAATNTRLEARYKTQAFVRPINFFYLKDNIRQRIEKEGEQWIVVNTDTSWDEDTLKAEIEQYPERFSPNVILRGLYQETILPNVAFIGGGSEVAYWMQLKSVFEHYGVFYPVVIPRQSIQFIDAYQQKMIDRLGYSYKDVFLSNQVLTDRYIGQNTAHVLNLDKEKSNIHTVLEAIKQKATRIDGNLEQSVMAALTKIKHQLAVVEKKMYRAEKRNQQTQINRINKLKDILFPDNALQERYFTFMQEYALLGDAYFEVLNQQILPFGDKFLMIQYEIKAMSDF